MNVVESQIECVEHEWLGSRRKSGLTFENDTERDGLRELSALGIGLRHIGVLSNLSIDDLFEEVSGRMT